MPRRKKRIDEDGLLASVKRTKTLPNTLILQHCDIQFKEPKISDSNDKNREVFELYSEDLRTGFGVGIISSDDKDAENIFYINLLLGTLMITEHRYRKVFIMYQACKQSDPITWLDSVIQVMIIYHQEISDATNDGDTFYDTTLGYLKDVRDLYMVHRKNDKMSISWNGTPTQFVELILALCHMEHKVEYTTGAKTENMLKCGSDIKNETTLIKTMASKLNFPIDDIFNHIEGIKRRKRRGDDKAYFLYDLIESLNSYCNRKNGE